jgi:hypothetical protein
MFVRWKRTKRLRRRRSTVRETGRLALVAMLVQAERRDGKPRQRVVAYLGTIGTDRLGHPYPRRWFWEKCDARLGSLTLEPAERARIEAAIEGVVPRPSPEEIAAAEQELAEAMKRSTP